MKANQLLTILFFTFFSCKKDRNEPNQVKTFKDNNLKIHFDLIVQKDDSLQLFYMDEGIPNFTEEYSQWKAIKGSTGKQHVSFVLPEPIIPTAIRFDFGKTKKQDNFKVLNFTMEYHDKKYSTKDSTMVYYFTVNEQLQFDSSTMTLNVVNTSSQSYDPFICSTDLFTKQVRNLVKE
jgi:hypothetical protein